MISIDRAAEIIRSRGIVAFPTETAYALGANALDEGAVKKIYELKKRPEEKKMPVIVDSLARLKGVAETEPLGEFLSHNLHPGPLNIVVKSNLPWIGAFRISSSRKAHEIAKRAELPVVATSANPAGEKPAYTPGGVKKYFEVPTVPGKLKDEPVSTIYDPKSRKIIRGGEVTKEILKRYEVAFDALQKIKPSDKEVKKTRERANRALGVVKKTHRNALVGGSIAKGTFLKGDNEADIFLLFPGNMKLDDRLGLLKEIALSIGDKAEVSFAQHPYVKGEYDGMNIELVPAYDVEPPIVKSAADRSRWHVEWVSQFPAWLKDEVRLLKQFCRGIGVYGADLKVEGFSAYSLEVLALSEGGFVKALERISSMKWPVRKSDPVDKKRNVLASASRRSFELLKEAATAYIEKPGKKFFFPNEPRTELPALKRTALMKLEKPDMVEDAVWGIAKKKARKIARNARVNGYKVGRKDVFVGDSVYLIFKVDSLGRGEVLVKGPPVERRLHAASFMDRHPKAYEDSGILYAREKNRFQSFRALLENFEKGEVFEAGEIKKIHKDAGKQLKLWLIKFLLNKKPWEY